MAKKSRPAWFVYLLQCTDVQIYCGILTDVEKRLSKHVAGKLFFHGQTMNHKYINYVL
jgi:predicted GIY-YIG superfamily endonuclease